MTPQQEFAPLSREETITIKKAELAQLQEELDEINEEIRFLCESMDENEEMGFLFRHEDPKVAYESLADNQEMEKTRAALEERWDINKKRLTDGRAALKNLERTQ